MYWFWTITRMVLSLRKTSEMPHMLSYISELFSAFSFTFVCQWTNVNMYSVKSLSYFALTKLTPSVFICSVTWCWVCGKCILVSDNKTSYISCGRDAVMEIISVNIDLLITAFLDMVNINLDLFNWNIYLPCLFTFPCVFASWM